MNNRHTQETCQRCRLGESGEAECILASMGLGSFERVRYVWYEMRSTFAVPWHAPSWLDCNNGILLVCRYARKR